MRSGLAKKRELEKLDGKERREIGNRSLKSSHIFLQTEGEQKPQPAPGCSRLHQNYLGDVELSGIMRNFTGRPARLVVTTKQQSKKLLVLNIKK